jgi:hypothetical protein
LLRQQKEDDKAIKIMFISLIILGFIGFGGFTIYNFLKKTEIAPEENAYTRCYINPLNCSRRNLCLLTVYGYNGLGKINYEISKDDWEKNYYDKFVEAVDTMNINCSKILD